MKEVKGNQSFFIAIIVSIFLHLFAIDSFNDLSAFWREQERKEQPVILTRVTFLAHTSFSEPIAGVINSSFQNEKEISVSKPDRDIAIAEKKNTVKNVEAGIIEKKEETIFTKEEIDQPPKILQRMINATIKEEDVLKQTISVLPEKKEKETIPSYEISEKKDPLPLDSSSETVQHFSQGEEKETSISEKNNTFRPEEEKINNFSQSDESSIEYANVNDFLKKQESPLDFTKNSVSGDEILPPEILNGSPPDYPETLRRRRIEGKVLLKVLINRQGVVTEAEIFSSSGYQAFDQAAVESVHQWKFKPAHWRNSARDSLVFIPVVFRLK